MTNTFVKMQRTDDMELPKEADLGSISYPTFFGDLRAFISDVVSEKPRQIDVLIRRFGLGGTKEYTLDAIGTSYGVTREMIRQDEVGAMNKTRKALLITTEFRSELSIDVTGLKRAVQVLESHLNIYGDFLTQTDVESALTRGLNIEPRPTDFGILNLLLRLLGYEKLLDSIPGFVEPVRTGWINTADNSLINQKELFAVVKILVTTLRKSDSPLSLFDLRGTINKTLKVNIHDDYIRSAASLCESVETINNGDLEPCFQIAFHSLGSMADKAYRILVEDAEHTPKHLTEILKEINHRMVANGAKPNVRARSLQQQLNDKRFLPIGRSGLWKLKDWDEIATGTIVEVMKELFYLENRKLTFGQVLEYVLSRRPDSAKNSVRTYILMDANFVKVSASEYELAEWGSKPIKNPLRTYTLNKPTKSQQIQNIVSDYLSVQPHKSATLEDLWKYVEAQISCQRPVFYASLSKMAGIQKHDTGGKTKICHLT